MACVMGPVCYCKKFIRLGKYQESIMKMKLASLVIAAFLANPAQAAGLWLSSTPLFVTEVLPPNVFLTPNYIWDAHEIAMKNPPADILSACLSGNMELCPNTVNPGSDLNYPNPSPFWVMATLNDYPLYARRQSSWQHSSLFHPSRGVTRLAPWPDVTLCSASNDVLNIDDDGNLASLAPLPCSLTAVYPSDKYKTRVNNLRAYRTEMYPMRFFDWVLDDYPGQHYTINPELTSSLETFLLYVGEEPYYQATANINDTDPITSAHPNSNYKLNLYDGARAMYFRSQDNFLYFDPDLTYRPWPSLGVDASIYSPITYLTDDPDNPSYDATKDPTYAYYNPLIKTRTDNSNLTARLSDPQGGTVYVWDGINPGRPNNSADALQYHIGSYFTRTENAPVWQAASYTRHVWEDFNLQKRINFANWFTYYRSSYLASRGMVAELIKSLSDRDMLHLFRLGLTYKTLTLDGDTYTGISNNFTVYLDAPSFNQQELLDVETRRTKSALFMQRFGERLYGKNTAFTANSRRDMNTVFNYMRTLSPYRDDPTNNNSTARSCRRNYEIILTPDYTGLRSDDNGTPLPEVGNEDLSLGSIYDDSYSNTWGDFGALGWKTDLVDLSNDLSPGKIDEATHQHLVRYLVGPKIDGRYFPSTITRYEDALAIASSDTFPGWPNVNQVELGIYNVNVKDAIDDLWHMVINSRGMFYPSENVTDAVNNLLTAFNDILVRNVAGAAVATNTTSLQSGGVIYQATVENDWRGHLKAYQVRETTTNGVKSLEVVYETTLWDLAESVSTTPHGNRVIFTYNRGSRQGVPFRWNSLDNATKSAIQSGFAGDATAEAAQAEFLVDYLRGSGQCEDGATTSCTANSVSYVFKRRNVDRSNHNGYSASNPNGRNVLGDIANSNPLVVTAPQIGVSDVNYPGYNAHRIARENRPSILYVGANDGMLHAVLVQEIKDGDVVTARPGKEIFSYIPSFVQDNLYRLSEQTAAHTYLVDGSPFAAEVNLGGNGEANDWRTVLAGGGNLGGRGYYLLDITNPINISETAENASNLVLWEFTSANDANLQYTYNLPVTYLDNHARAGQARQIVRLKEKQGDGTFLSRWAMVVGNGYQKADPDNPGQAGQQACLFILYLTGPGEGGAWVLNTHYRRYCVGLSDYGEDGGYDTNGLSTPTPLDSDGDGHVDVVYAGDLNGNVWRFNIGSDVLPASWGVAYGNANTGGTPLFVARDDNNRRQPIVTPVEAARMSQNNAAGNTTVSGQLILFGTGKYLEATDRADTSVQAFYGVWDRGFSNLDRGDLLERTVAQSTISGKDVRTTADDLEDLEYCAENAANLCNDRVLGWYWDMPTVGERITGRISLFGGRVHFNTFYPELDPGGSGSLDPCQYGGDGWIMAFDAVGGYMVAIDYSDGSAGGIFDLSGDGVVNASDATVAGVRVGAAIGGTTFARGVGGGMVGVYSPADLGTHKSEGDRMIMHTSGNTSTSGRVSWYELLD